MKNKIKSLMYALSVAVMTAPVFASQQQILSLKVLD